MLKLPFSGLSLYRKPLRITAYSEHVKMIISCPPITVEVNPIIWVLLLQLRGGGSRNNHFCMFMHLVKPKWTRLLHAVMRKDLR